MTNNTKYRILQFFYSGTFCFSYGYIAYYLQEVGFPASQIGLLTSLFALLAIAIQPYLGRLMDTNVKYGWKTLGVLFSVAYLVDLLLLWVVKNYWVIGICYSMQVFFVNCLLPLMNTIAFYYEDKEEPIQYGIARGIGSLGYAVISYILGQFVLITGKNAILITASLTVIIILGTLLTLPYDYHEVKKTTDHLEERKHLFRKYPSLMWMVISCACLLTFHNAAQTYLIQMIEPFGGNAGTIGIALAISAIFELPPMFLLARLLKRIKVERLLLIAAFGFILKAIGYSLMNSVGFLYVVQTLQMISYAITISASVYFANDSVEERDRASGQAYIGMAVAIGTVVGNLLGGWIIDLFGLKGLFFMNILFTIAGFCFGYLSIISRKDVYYR